MVSARQSTRIDEDREKAAKLKVKWESKYGPIEPGSGFWCQPKNECDCVCGCPSDSDSDVEPSSKAEKGKGKLFNKALKELDKVDPRGIHAANLEKVQTVLFRKKLEALEEVDPRKVVDLKYKWMREFGSVRRGRRGRR